MSKSMKELPIKDLLQEFRVDVGIEDYGAQLEIIRRLRALDRLIGVPTERDSEIKWAARYILDGAE